MDVNCGTYATFATTADGHVFAFGLNNYGQLALPGEQPQQAQHGRLACSGDCAFLHTTHLLNITIGAMRCSLSRLGPLCTPPPSSQHRATRCTVP